MTTARKISANRKNARRSTGPRSAAGKAHAKRNALRHGLATCISNDAVVGPEIERLMRYLALYVDDPNRLWLAKEIAEAEFEVLRVRRVRTGLLDRMVVNRGAFVRPSDQPQRALPEKGPSIGKDLLPAVAAAVQRAAPELTRLERYERRALSRRKRAIRELFGRGL